MFKTYILFIVNPFFPAFVNVVNPFSGGSLVSFSCSFPDIRRSETEQDTVNEKKNETTTKLKLILPTFS